MDFRFQYLIWIVCLGLLSCEDNSEKEVVYYDNGRVRYEVFLKNKLWHGELVEYFANGTVNARSYWKEGKINGKAIIFYPNGKIQNVSYYNNGKRYFKSYFYQKDGILREIQNIDGRGRVYDYIKFNKDGKKDLRIATRYPLFLPERDTVHLGETYEVKIKLGNKEYNSIEVVVGDPNDKFILKNNPKLPKLDSITAIYRVKVERSGINEISGVIVDIDKVKRSEMVIIPFEYKFFVKP